MTTTTTLREAIYAIMAKDPGLTPTPENAENLRKKLVRSIQGFDAPVEDYLEIMREYYYDKSR